MQDLNDKVTGSTLTASEFNEPMSELQNIIEDTGQVLSSGDLDQVGKGVSAYVANGAFYTDSGAADAYVLTSIGLKQSLPAYTDGALFEFIADNPNTGASTANAATLGVKNIKLPDGTDPAAGQIAGRTILKFDSANDWLELQQSGMKNIVIFTAGGTYTPPAGLKNAKFTATGGGGGGGGADGQGAGTGAVGAGGGAGGTCMISANNIESSYTVVIGAAGTAGAATAGTGGTGGTTTVVSVAVSLSAVGGGGGTGATGTSGAAGGGGTGGNGGTATGGDINLVGQGGSSGRVTSGDPAALGDSGGSFWGGGVRGQSNAAGITALTVGAGGGGGASLDVATNRAGGAGFRGEVSIEESF